MSPELGLAAGAALGVVLLALYIIIRPAALGSTVQLQLDSLRAELAETKSEVRQLRREKNEQSEEIIRLKEQNAWLRTKLRDSGINIGPLPEELRDPRQLLPAMHERRAVLLDKIEELGKQEAIASAGAEKFKLQQELLAAKQELRELDAE